MSAYALEWLGLVVRWIHVITGIAWIGASFYFNWLEGRLERDGKPEGIAGDLWSVHGGGFYHVQKYEVAPEQLPETLHWFKWEAYSTWLSGFALLLIVYYLNPAASLLGANPLGVSTTFAVVTGLGTLIAGWGLYHGLCTSGLAHRPVALTILGFVLATAIAFGLSQVFDGRAAFIHMGAMIGTIMAANVLFVIIPAQRLMVDAMMRGERPDPAPGKAALQRSLHNNYLTLPVVFVMISAHFPSTFGSEWNWAILAALSFGSAGVRHFFNLRNQGQRKVWILPAATAFLLALAWVSKPLPPQAAADSGAAEVRFWQVRQIMDTHCVSCHSVTPTDAFFQVAPLGLMLDTPEQIQAAADKILARTVTAETMPFGNPAAMTAEERVLLGRWIAEGAPLR